MIMAGIFLSFHNEHAPPEPVGMFTFVVLASLIICHPFVIGQLVTRCDKLEREIALLKDQVARPSSATEVHSDAITQTPRRP
jgi:hypothetical protein